MVVQEGATPPWTGILEVSMATGKTGKDKLRSEGDPGTDGRLPPPGLKLCLFIEQRVTYYVDTAKISNKLNVRLKFYIAQKIYIEFRR